MLLGAPLPLGDVDDRGQHERSLVGLERIEADLDGTSVPSLAKAEEVRPAHVAGAGVGEERSPVARMGAAKPLGDEHLDGLSRRLRRA
jgi:hypothetical protein